MCDPLILGSSKMHYNFLSTFYSTESRNDTLTCLFSKECLLFPGWVHWICDNICDNSNCNCTLAPSSILELLDVGFSSLTLALWLVTPNLHPFPKALLYIMRYILGRMRPNRTFALSPFETVPHCPLQITHDHRSCFHLFPDQCGSNTTLR